MLVEFRIDNDTMTGKEKRNNEAYQLFQRGQRGFYSTVIQSIRAKKSGFYLLHINDFFEILEFDNNGNLMASYRSKLLNEYHPTEFIVKEDGDSKLFYLLQVSPSSTIDVFRPKEVN